jgi:hypothetical protein
MCWYLYFVCICNTLKIVVWRRNLKITSARLYDFIIVIVHLMVNVTNCINSVRND